MMKYLSFLFLLLLFLSCKQKTGECTELKELSRYIVEDSVTLKLSYVAYACGECMSFYNIDSVIFSKNNKGYDYYNKEILIKYLNSEPEEPMYVDNCPTKCTSYIFTGYLTRNGFGVIRLNVSHGNIFIDEKCCEENISNE